MAIPPNPGNLHTMQRIVPLYANKTYGTKGQCECLMSSPRYSADITAGSLKLRESRLVANLLLEATDEQIQTAIAKDNVLQCRTTATAIRLARLIRGRLAAFDCHFWRMVRDGDKTLAVQCLFAAAVKHSALLSDFVDLALKAEFRALHTTLPSGLWWSFLEGCEGRDPLVAGWSEHTRRRLRSTVFQILAQVGLLKDTKSRVLHRVVIIPDLMNYLQNRGEVALLDTIRMP